MNHTYLFDPYKHRFWLPFEAQFGFSNRPCWPQEASNRPPQEAPEAREARKKDSEEEQAELLGNPLLLQLEEQQEVKLSDQQLHEELDEKENRDELLLDDDDRLLELLQVEELQLTLEYDPQDPDNEDEELDPLP